MKKKIQLVIADDQKIFCEILGETLSKNEKINLRATIHSVQELIEYVQNFSFDVLILDVSFKGIDSLDYIDKIRPKKEAFKIIVLTTSNNNYVKNKAYEQGVDFFAGKDTKVKVLQQTVLDCYNNLITKSPQEGAKIIVDNKTFTKRNIEILKCLYEHSNKKEKLQAETILYISPTALKSHKQTLFEITGAKNTQDLIKFGIQNGLILS